MSANQVLVDNKHCQNNWSAEDIQNALNENNDLLDEWDKLIKKNEFQTPENISFEEVNRHHFLVRYTFE